MNKSTAKKLKVYGWRGWRSESPPAPNGSHQTREICAATSMKALATLMGEKGPHALDCLCETGNEEEIRVAMASPHTVFWRPQDGRSEFFSEKKTPFRVTSDQREELMKLCAQMREVDDGIGQRSDHEGDEGGPTYRVFMECDNQERYEDIVAAMVAHHRRGIRLWQRLGFLRREVLRVSNNT